MNKTIDAFIAARKELRSRLEAIGLGDFLNAMVDDLRGQRWGVQERDGILFVCVEVGEGKWCRGTPLCGDERLLIEHGDLTFVAEYSCEGNSLTVLRSSMRDDKAVVLR